jgi:hypothetical protein
VIEYFGNLQDEARELIKYLSLDILQSSQHSECVLSHPPQVMGIHEIDYED